MGPTLVEPKLKWTGNCRDLLRAIKAAKADEPLQEDDDDDGEGDLPLEKAFKVIGRSSPEAFEAFIDGYEGSLSPWLMEDGTIVVRKSSDYVHEESITAWRKGMEAGLEDLQSLVRF